MSGIFTMPGPNTTSFDLGLGRRKKNVDVAGDDYLLGASIPTTLFNAAAVSAGQANTVVQAIFALPGRCKIPKIVVYCSAIEAVAGHYFNIVLGTAAYTASATSVPGNDNASVPPVSYGANGAPTGTSPLYPAGGGGIASNPAVAGNTFFQADVQFNLTYFPTLTTGGGTGPTYGQLIVPANPDAIWPNGGILTLRCISPGGGSISNLVIGAVIALEPLSPTDPSSQYPSAYVPVPGISF
jgi:hypothetical protein